MRRSFINTRKIKNSLFYILLSCTVSACSTITNSPKISSQSFDGTSNSVVASLLIGTAISAALANRTSTIAGPGAPVTVDDPHEASLVPFLLGVATAIYLENKNKKDKPEYTPTYFPEQETEVTGEFLIVSEKGKTINVDKTLEIEEQYTLKNIPLTLYRININGVKASKINDFQHSNPQATIQPNYYYYLDGKEENSKRKLPQYALNLLGLKENRTELGSGIRIGIIDTPLDQTHPELRKAQINQKNLINSKGKVHATALAGILVGSGRLKGVVPDAQITSVGAFEEETKSRSSGKSTSFILAKAFDHIIGEKVNVLNLSFGSSKPDPLMKRLIYETLKQKIKIVASVGNDGNNVTARYPAAFEGVMGITAIDSQSRLYNKANTGSAVDYSLPGVNIITSKPGGRYTSISGTSFASAYASGIFALHLSQKRNIDKLNLDVQDLGKSGKDNFFGRGLLKSSN